MFQLGIKVREKITGCEGILTGKASYLTGCNQYLVQPVAKEGAYVSGNWFDEGRYEKIGEGITAPEVASDKNGCDVAAPVK